MPFGLLIVDPEGRARQQGLRPGELQLGRGKGNDLVLVARGVSRHHARLIVEHDRLEIEDRDSTYGTKVNGQQVRRATLAVGDHVDIGVFRLIVIPPAERIVTARPGAASDGPDVMLFDPPGTFTGVPDTTASVMTTSEHDLTRGAYKIPDAATLGLDPSTTFDSDMAKADGPEQAGEAAQQDSETAPQEPQPDEAPRPERGLLAAKDPVTAKGDERIPDVDALLGPAGLAAVLRTTTSVPMPEEALAELQHREATQVLLLRSAEQLGSSADLGAFQERALDLLVEHLGVTTAAILAPDELGSLEVRKLRHDEPVQRGRLPYSRTVADRALELRQAVQSPDLRADHSFGPRDSLVYQPKGAVIALPLLERQQARGVLYLTKPAVERFTPTETETLRALASMLAKALSLADSERVAMERERRHETLERFHTEEVLEELFALGDSLLGLRAKTATILHVELDGFRAAVQTRGATAAMSQAVLFRTLVHEAVQAHGGTITWLHEQSGQALFSAEGQSSGDAAWALRTATQLLDDYQGDRRPGSQSDRLTLRIGLDRGKVHVGVIGPDERLHYAALGAAIHGAHAASRSGNPGTIRATHAVLRELPNPPSHVQRVQDSAATATATADATDNADSIGDPDQ